MVSNGIEGDGLGASDGDPAWAGGSAAGGTAVLGMGGTSMS